MINLSRFQSETSLLRLFQFESGFTRGGNNIEYINIRVLYTVGRLRFFTIFFFSFALNARKLRWEIYVTQISEIKVSSRTELWFEEERSNYKCRSYWVFHSHIRSPRASCAQINSVACQVALRYKTSREILMYTPKSNWHHPIDITSIVSITKF